MSENLTLNDFYIARRRISPVARKTPLVTSPDLTTKTGKNVYLKLENLQVTGSFKIRGAANKILSLSDDARQRGVITVSTGNHGKAVAYVSGELGAKATICVAKSLPEYKRQAMKSLGAELVVVGENADETMIYADQLRAERGMTMVHNFDDLNIIGGQGTIGLELFEDLPDIDTVIMPLSGGGLLSGIGFSLKSIKPDIHVVGVSMDRGPAMVDSLKAGRVVDIVEEPTLAGALAGGLNKDNRYSFQMVQQYVDETVLVSEKEIAEAMMFCLRQQRIVVEGGAAVGVAALLSNKVKYIGNNIAVVITGSNVSMETLKMLLDQGERR
jgi:threonine dehydratase